MTFCIFTPLGTSVSPLITKRTEISENTSINIPAFMLQVSPNVFYARYVISELLIILTVSYYNIVITMPIFARN